MIHLFRLVVGPVSGVECRRSLCRGWLFVARGVSALVAGGLVVVWAWSWWFLSLVNPSSLPGTLGPSTLASLESVLITVALVLGPALLAGAIAGERDRGSLALLLTSRLSSYEIVAGRLWPPLTQLGLMLSAALPPLVILAVANGVGLKAFGMMVTLPAAVGLGSGGLALLASAMSRRARDALLVVYLLELLAVVAPLFGAGWATTEGMRSLGVLSPFHGVADLTWLGRPEKALLTAAVWALVGTLSTAVTAWRLRPLAVRRFSGTAPSVRQRRARVPPVHEHRPVLWKELYIERVATLGRFGRWLAWTISAALLAGAVALTALTVRERWLAPANGGLADLSWTLRQWLSGSALPLSWMLQWAIGLRAAVGIAAERERHTWDALLATPLSGAEIVWPKLWGSLYALRGLIVSLLIAWTLAVLCGALDIVSYVSRLADTVVVGWFLAAVGVRLSLTATTLNRAMAQTIAVWLGAAAVTACAAGVIALMIGLAVVLGWQLLVVSGAWVAPLAGGTFPAVFAIGWTLVRLALYVLLAALVAVHTGRRFNDLAGRMPLRRRSVPIPPARLVHSI